MDEGDAKRIVKEALDMDDTAFEALTEADQRQKLQDLVNALELYKNLLDLIPESPPRWIKDGIQELTTSKDK